MKRISTKTIKAEEGNVLVMVALSMVVLLLMTALVIDVGNLLYRRVHLQNAADAAALAAAIEGATYEGEPDEEAMKDEAIEYIKYHGLEEINLSTFTYDSGKQTVALTLTAEEPLFFGPLVKIDYWSFGMQSSANWVYSDSSFSFALVK